ncbi:hypothetical protein B0J17DRAFT_417949 [Rhizoctonia solani]|nr:hypothetical protein B0J17DRAFT_417949 [Rhizoctonia solani]
MLTFDCKRTGSYLGCVITQAVANCCTCSLIVLFMVAYNAQWEFFNLYLQLYPCYASLGIFALLVGLCSLGLLGIDLWSMIALRSNVPIKQVWRTNTKDAYKGVAPLITIPHALSLLGHPREATIPFGETLGGLVRIAKRFLARLLFRRVRPVETRIYAFTRNSFAVVAMGILIFRTITVLQNAQNEIETRVTSIACDEYPPVHRLSILSDRLIYDTRWNASLPDNVTITVSVVYNDASKGYDPYNKTDCTVVWAKPFNNSLGYGLFQNRVLERFECPWIRDPIFNTIGMQFTQGDMSDSFGQYRRFF